MYTIALLLMGWSAAAWRDVRWVVGVAERRAGRPPAPALTS